MGAPPWFQWWPRHWHLSACVQLDRMHIKPRVAVYCAHPTRTAQSLGPTTSPHVSDVLQTPCRTAVVALVNVDMATLDSLEWIVWSAMQEHTRMEQALFLAAIVLRVLSNPTMVQDFAPDVQLMSIVWLDLLHVRNVLHTPNLRQVALKLPTAFPMLALPGQMDRKPFHVRLVRTSLFLALRHALIAIQEHTKINQVQVHVPSAVKIHTRPCLKESALTPALPVLVHLSQASDLQNACVLRDLQGHGHHVKSAAWIHTGPNNVFQDILGTSSWTCV
jgi:hypothetical protein